MAGVLLATAVVVWLLYRMRNILFMVFVAGFLAIAMEPAVHFLEKRGWKRGRASGLVFFGAFLVFVLFVIALVPLFVRQIDQMADDVPEYVQSIADFLEDTLGIQLSQPGVAEESRNLSDILNTIGTSGLLGGVVGLTAGVINFLFFATTVAIFAFYMVAELPKLQRTLLSYMPPDRQRDALHVWEIAVEKMGGYVYSRLILAVLSGTVATVFLMILGVPFALSLGIWVGVLSQFIPVIGTYLAAILPAVVALSSKGPWTALWVIVFFVAYQQVENYAISPRITRRTMEIHPAVSIGAILIGGTLFGGVGVILALPVAGIIQALISESSAYRHPVVPEAAEQGEET